MVHTLHRPPLARFSSWWRARGVLLRVAVAAAFAVALLVRCSGEARACDCPPPPETPKAFAKAAVVAVAVIERIEPRPVVHRGNTIEQTGKSRAHLRVHRTWKGAKPGDEIVIEREAESTCSYDLAEGTTHLFFLERAPNGGLDASAGHCGRSRVLASAGDEMSALDHLAKPSGSLPSGSASPPAAVAPPSSNASPPTPSAPPPASSAAPAASPAPPSAPASGGCAACATTSFARSGWETPCAVSLALLALHRMRRARARSRRAKI